MSCPDWISAQADNRIPNLRRQPFNMLRIPRIVAVTLAG